MSTLTVRTGNAPGACLRIKHDGRELLDHEGGHVWAGTIEDWTTAAVCTSTGPSARFWRLVPAGDDAPELEIALSGLVVRGRFTIAEKINNAKRASESFALFQKRLDVLND